MITQKIKAVDVLQKSTQESPEAATDSTLKKIEKCLNEYYEEKKTRPDVAIKHLEEALSIDPLHFQANSELGYYYLQKNDKEKALEYFLKAEERNPEDIQTVSQIGYIFNDLKRNHESFNQFEKAFHMTTDVEKEKQHYESMVNLMGWRHTLFPKPVFFEMYTSPMRQNRFHDSILPIISHLGVKLGNREQYEIYFSFRFTKDTRSGGGELPAIFEDNAMILAGGFAYRPLEQFDLKLFAETGAGYDLIYRNQDRWREDTRAGTYLSKNWGKPPSYYHKIQMPLDPIMDYYGDAIFYTRYDNNFITEHRLRPGIRLLGFKTATIDIYGTTFLFLDTNREFYNNRIDYGPGIALTPDTRENLKIRFEALSGDYFNIKTKSPNPYKRHYTNSVFLIEYYVSI